MAMYLTAISGWISTYPAHAYYSIREWTTAVRDSLLTSLSGGPPSLVGVDEDAAGPAPRREYLDPEVPDGGVFVIEEV